MKRLLISLICIFTFAALSAQNYSELDLIGEWDLVEGTGVMGLTSLSVNNLSAVHGNYSNQDGGEFKTGSSNGSINYSIKDIFITSGNILHIYMNPSSSSTSPTLTRVRMIIKSLDSGMLSLSSLDGNIYFTMKKKESTDVAYIKAKHTNNNVYYNLQGMKITDLSNSKVYIHNGKKLTSK